MTVEDRLMYQSQVKLQEWQMSKLFDEQNWLQEQASSSGGPCQKVMTKS